MVDIHLTSQDQPFLKKALPPGTFQSPTRALSQAKSTPSPASSSGPSFTLLFWCAAVAIGLPLAATLAVVAWRLLRSLRQRPRGPTLDGAGAFTGCKVEFSEDPGEPDPVPRLAFPDRADTVRVRLENVGTGEETVMVAMLSEGIKLVLDEDWRVVGTLAPPVGSESDVESGGTGAVAARVLGGPACETVARGFDEVMTELMDRSATSRGRAAGGREKQTGLLQTVAQMVGRR